MKNLTGQLRAPRAHSALICVIAGSLLAPVSSQASHEAVQGRLVSMFTGNADCASATACQAFFATGCPADDPLYKEDQHPFISVKSVAAFTGKARTGTLRLTGSSPLTFAHGLILVTIKECDTPPQEFQWGVLQVGESVPIQIPKGTRWVAVYLQNSFGFLSEWKLTLNHLP